MLGSGGTKPPRCLRDLPEWDTVRSRYSIGPSDEDLFYEKGQNVMRTSIFMLCLAVVILGCASGRSPNFQEANTNALTAAQKELRDAAAAHKVSIQTDRMAYASDQRTTIVHAPISGIERYGDSDFAAGAPIQLLVIGSSARLGIPSGSYVVKAQYSPGAISGHAIFTDSKGTVVARKDLIVRTRAQAVVLFPGLFPETTDGEPLELPNITSTHVWINTPNGPRLAVDCAGWDPYRIIYYYIE